MMRSSYKKEDVTLLLKDITGLVKPLPAAEREPLIQSGVHYCEMLPLEKKPTEKYLKLYETALKNYTAQTAEAVITVSEKLYRRTDGIPVLVSLARAGTPAGILIKRYLEGKYGISVPHYTISIIRGRGIDKNAVDYILSRHDPKLVRFIDGWTGKGAILRTLREALSDYPQLSPELAVLADPAYITDLCGTHDDFLIASSCLNCTVSGLMSRTFLRDDIIGENDFHGSAFYGELAAEDRTYEFIDAVMARINFGSSFTPKEIDEFSAETKMPSEGKGLAETKRIADAFGISDINLVKPGIGETTRVLLRRVPDRILVRSLSDTAYIGHILRLAEENGVPVEEYPLECYRACGIIRSMADT